MEKLQEIKNGKYPCMGNVLGWIMAVIGAVLSFSGYSNLTSYVNKATAPYQLGAGATLLIMGLLFVVIGNVSSELKRQTNILYYALENDIDIKKQKKSLMPEQNNCSA